MERLTAEDQIMLWPDEIWPQDIGAVAILDGTALLDPAGRLPVRTVQRAIATRLHLVPRFRQVLHHPRRGLGPPLWVDAPRFDLADHVRVVPIDPPGDEARLLLAVERLRRQRLDMSRPLWEMCFLTGLPDHRIGLFVRMHHVIADGIAGVATVGAFLDSVADPPAVPAPPWTPAPLPAGADLLGDNLRRHARTLSALARPVRTARRVRAALPAMRGQFAAQPTPDTSLNRSVGPDRRLALIRGDIDQVRRIAHAKQATVNDVLLAAVASGLRGLLDSRGELADGLTIPVYVPVTLRPEQARAQARGNQVGQMIVPLPVGLPDPGQRLHRITVETARCKAKSHPSLGVALHGRLVRRALMKALDRYPINLTTADLPGPRQPVYFGGARVLEVFPVLPLIANVTLGVGALSYAEQFNLTVVADRDAYPDLDVFVAGARDELRVLTASGRRTG
jgi:diacylglycerol O-acyltransferase / wax synthase